jgi:2'-5' RNA ligase
VTILFPFLAQTELSPGVVKTLEKHFARFAPFRLTLRETGTFPRVLYLKPEPRALLAEIISSTSSLFPDLLPYGGLTGEEIPHVTVVHAEEDQDFEGMCDRCEESLARHGPIQTAVSRVTLMARSRNQGLDLNSFELHGESSHGGPQ